MGLHDPGRDGTGTPPDRAENTLAGRLLRPPGSNGTGHVTRNGDVRRPVPGHIGAVCGGGRRGTGGWLPHRTTASSPLPGGPRISPEPTASRRQLPSPQVLVAAVQDALGSYSWGGLTATTVAALAVAAVDHARAPGNPSVVRATLGGRLVRPAPRSDERVGALVLELGGGQGWREQTVREVARRLVAGLGAAEEARLWLDLELTWLLEPPA